MTATITHTGTHMAQRVARCLLAGLAILLCVGTAHAQTTGTLAPFASQQYLDNNGNVCNGCLLYSYSTGTTTPATTYADAQLTTPNPNPVVLDSAGRAAVYLSSASFKLVLKTSAGVTLWTRDPVSAVPFTTIAASFNSTCDGRISLTASTPVTTSDVTAATTVRWVPYKGNRCALYDGSQWNLSSFTELTLSLGTDTANTNYDLFLYLSSGTPTLERVAWTNDTTRATNITFQDGVYVKSGDTTRRYLGTYRTTGSAGQTEDSAAKRFVWNYYNRVPRALRVTDATASWTYTTAAYRQANGSTANQVAVVVGVAEVTARISLIALVQNTNTLVNVISSIGEDSAVTPATGAQFSNVSIAAANAVQTMYAQLVRSPAIGYHYYTWLENSAATGTSTWSSSNTAGLSGHIEGEP